MSNEQTGWQQTSDLLAQVTALEAENKLLLESAHAKSEECNGFAAQVIALRNENARLREALQVADTYVDGLQFFEGADVATIWSVQGVIRHALKISDDANTGGKEGA